MANARVQIIHEVTADGPEWKLCLQWCRYFHDGGDLEEGYRFMWRRPDGSLQAARGQARIPSRAVADQLWAKVDAAGWGGMRADDAHLYENTADPK